MVLNLLSALKYQNRFLIYHLGLIILFSILYQIIAPHTEDKENFKSYDQTLYFTVVTHFTVGYGDISPKSRILRRLCMAQILMAFIFFQL